MSSKTSPGAWSYSMTAYWRAVAARRDSTSGTLPSPAWRWSRLADPNSGASGANGLLAGATPSLMCSAIRRSPRRATSAGDVLSTGERPEQIQLDRDAVLGQLDEPLVRGLPVEGGDELLRVIVVAHGEPELGGDLGRGVDAVGDVLHAVLGQPAVRRDEGVDHCAHADGRRGLEHDLGLGGGDRAVRRPEHVGEQRSMAGGRRETRGVQRRADLLGAAHEVERLDVLQADRRQTVERAVHVGGELLGKGVELDGCFG